MLSSLRAFAGTTMGVVSHAILKVDRVRRARHGGRYFSRSTNSHMFSIASLWIPFTIIAALGQVARNAMQRQLTGPLGTWGATNIRFLFGFTFSIAGVVIAALRPGSEKGFADLKPTLLGLAAAAAFALSAVGFRGAVITVPGVTFVTAASFTLVLGLFVQTLVLTIYLLARAPDV